MKNTKSALVELRNSTIIWLIISIILIVVLWFSYNFFSQLGAQLVIHNQKKEKTISNITAEGIISDQEITATSIDSMRWATIQKYVPGIQTTIWATGTPEWIKNIETIKRITSKGNGGQEYKEYRDWLKASWDSQSKENLDQIQKDIADIIPIFSGISDNENTKHIYGKITLKKLIDFIQTDITKAYHLGNVMGSIGIDSVKFKEWTDIWAYDIPLKFDKVENRDIMDFLDFLAKTWGIKVQKMVGGKFAIKHLDPRILSRSELATAGDSNITQLKNPLIIVQNLVIRPSEKDVTLSTESSQKWDITMTLTFYIRWASSDYILTMDTKLQNLLWEANNPLSLLWKAGVILQNCKKDTTCSDENKISDIINLLNVAKNTYKGIRDADKTSSPVAIVTRRSELTSTVMSLEKKLTQIENSIKEKNASK